MGRSASGTHERIPEQCSRSEHKGVSFRNQACSDLCVRARLQGSPRTGILTSIYSCVLRRRKKGTTPDFVYKGMTAKAAQVSRVQNASHDTRVLAQARHSFLIRTLRCLRSKLMLCPLWYAGDLFHQAESLPEGNAEIGRQLPGRIRR